jgi:hypothetical protein
MLKGESNAPAKFIVKVDLGESRVVLCQSTRKAKSYWLKASIKAKGTLFKPLAEVCSRVFLLRATSSAMSYCKARSKPEYTENKRLSRGA